MEKPIDAHFVALEGKATCKHCGRAVSDQGLAKVSHLPKCKPRKLLVMNGRGDYGYSGFDGHFYVAAHSKAEAVRLLKAAGYKTMSARELDVYWSKNAWGVRMDGIEPEMGVWFVPAKREREDGFKPLRLI